MATVTLIDPTQLKNNSFVGVRMATTYNFTAQHPGGTLTAAVPATITLSPVPLGVNGSDAQHWLYITGGTGTAEAVLITGGTAVAGGVTGTITFTPANNHSGAWTIVSATGGGAEAHQAITTAGGVGVVQFTSVSTFHQGVYCTSGADRTEFLGLGSLTLLIARATDYIAGDLFHNSSGGAWTMRDLGITQSTGGTTSGAGVYVGPGQISMDHIAIFNGQYGVRLVGAVSTSLNDVDYVNTDMTFKATAGLSLEGLCVNIFVSNSQFIGSPVTNANVLTDGIRILSADGVWITNTVVSADIGIRINPVGNYIANMRFDQIGLDQVRNYGVVFTGAAFPINNIRFSGGHLHSQSDGATLGLAPTIYFDPTATVIDEISFSGTLIAGSAVEGVQVLNSGMKSLIFCGCSIVDSNRSNTAGLGGMKLATGVSGLDISGCVIGNTLGLGHQKYGIITLGTLSATITGNNMNNNETGAVSLGGALTGVLANNGGIDEISPAVASASSLALPVNPNFTITGTTGVGTVTGQWAGRRGTYICTSGSVVFTAGASIGNTVTCVQNKPYTFYSDGVKFWINGPGA